MRISRVCGRSNGCVVCISFLRKRQSKHKSRRCSAWARGFIEGALLRFVVCRGLSNGESHSHGTGDGRTCRENSIVEREDDQVDWTPQGTRIDQIVPMSVPSITKLYYCLYCNGPRITTTAHRLYFQLGATFSTCLTLGNTERVDMTGV